MAADGAVVRVYEWVAGIDVAAAAKSANALTQPFSLVAAPSGYVPMIPLMTSIEQFISHSDAHAMPAIVMKAREDAQCRLALARLGYFKVRSAYVRHKREGKDTFVGLDHELLAPTLEFVGDWLREERKQLLGRARRPFLVAMLVTIVAGIAFVAVATVLG